jgi:hypothetical protein
MWTLTREAVIAITRTATAYVYAWLLSLAPPISGFFAELNVTEEGFTVVVGTVLYIIIREVAKRIPVVGRLLIFNNEPSYN